MEYRSLFHRMLGLSETEGEVTPYRLLGVDPDRCTRPDVEQALNQRRKLLRQSVPDPRFIPMVLTFEKELENIAALLLDPAQRQALDERLPQPPDPSRAFGTGREAERPAPPRRRRRPRPEPPARPPAKPPPTPPRRPRPDTDVTTVIRRLPPRRPAFLVDGVDPETLDFFDTAVDLTISQGILLGEDEHRLLAMASRLNIPWTSALDVIERRLALKAAARAVPDEELLKVHFANQLRRWSADGGLSAAERTTLLQLAVSQGLGGEEAADVMERYLASPENPFSEWDAPVPAQAGTTLDLLVEVDDATAEPFELEDASPGPGEEAVIVLSSPEPVHPGRLPQALPPMTAQPSPAAADWKWYTILSLVVALTLALVAVLAVLLFRSG